MNYRDAWKLMADELGGTYNEARRYYESVELPHKNFSFRIDLERKEKTGEESNEMVNTTRMRTTFLNKKDGFSFIIQKNNIFAKIFKQNKVEIGDYDLDKKYAVQSSDEELIKALLTDDEVRSLLLDMKGVSLHANYGIKEVDYVSILELKRTLSGEYKNIEVMKQWYHLFTVLIDRMIELGITEDMHTEMRMPDLSKLPFPFNKMF